MRGKDRRARGAGNRDAPVLQRLAQHLEHPAIELRHLVEEQHAVVRERDLAGARNRAAADQGDVRDRVMRRAERPRCRADPHPAGSVPATEWIAVHSSASSKVSGGRIPPSRRASIVLPAPGGPDSSRLCPPAAATSSARRAQQLSAHVGEIAVRGLSRRRHRRRRRDARSRRVGMVERLDRLRQRARDAHVEAIDDAGFGRVVRRQQQALQPEAPRGDGNRQHAADAVDRAVERQLAEDDGVVDGAAGHAGRMSPAGRARSAGRTTTPPCARRPARG